MEHARIIEHLGGYARVAALLGTRPTTPHKWGERGIPAAHWPAIVRISRKHGLKITIEDIAIDANPSVFRGAKLSQPRL